MCSDEKYTNPDIPDDQRVMIASFFWYSEYISSDYEKDAFIL